jgi:Fic family protein
MRGHPERDPVGSHKRRATRAGRYVAVPEGYRAFLPAPLPPDPPLAADALDESLGRSRDALQRLSSVIDRTAHLAALEHMYMRREAVASSQIEGVKSTLRDLLVWELRGASAGGGRDVEETARYARAGDYALSRAGAISLDLIRGLHRELFDGLRPELAPGEFRSNQNYIAIRGAADIGSAVFVPPPAAEMRWALQNLEVWLKMDHPIHPLLRIGLAHAQFLTIHPFLDGNGRIARLLTTLLLVRMGLQQRAVLDLSGYLRSNRREYYGSLMSVRDDGDWERWLSFFLRAIEAAAREGIATATRVATLVRLDAEALNQRRSKALATKLRALLLVQPIIDTKFIQTRLRIRAGDADELLASLVAARLLRPERHRGGSVFVYEEYMRLFAAAPLDPDETPQATSVVLDESSGF